MTPGGSDRLLVAIVNDPEKVDEILAGFLELGIRGATIISSEGMGQLLSHDIPIFAGLHTLLSGSRPQNRTILSVLPESAVPDVIELLQDVTGNLNSPATGIVFTLPVDQVVGLAPELGGTSSPI
jgi:nitrogen regulatory protein PII